MQDDRDAPASNADSGPDESVSGRDQGRWRRTGRVLSKPVNAILLAFMVALVGAVATWLVNVVFDWKYRIDIELNLDRIQSQRLQGVGEYLIGVPVGDIGPPPIDANTCSGRYEWAREMGAVDVSSTIVRVSVAAQEGHQVHVVGARRVPVGDRNEPAVGSVLTCPGRGGEPVRYLDLDLDADDAMYFDGQSLDPQELSLPVTGGTTEVIDIVASTSEADWSYRIELVFVIDGTRHIEIIDNDGAPLRTTAPTNARSYQWIDGHWQDMTAGASPPALEPPAEIPHACSLVTVEEASGVIEMDLDVRTELQPQVGWGPSGHLIATAICVYASTTEETVQVSIGRTGSDEEALLEFETQLALIDPDGIARDFEDERTKIVNNNGMTRVLALNASSIIDISISRPDGIDELDLEHVTELLEIARQRLQPEQ